MMFDYFPHNKPKGYYDNKPFTKLDDAFEYLYHLIGQGIEYPEAHTRACCKYDLSDEQAEILTQRYDAMCI